MGEAALAMKLNAKAEDIGTIIHPHPSLLEVLWEAALDTNEESIHFMSKGERFE